MKFFLKNLDEKLISKRKSDLKKVPKKINKNKIKD